VELRVDRTWEGRTERSECGEEDEGEREEEEEHQHHH